MELHFFPNPEIQHLGMRSHLAQKSQARHDLVIELNQFILGECIDIDPVHLRPCLKSQHRMNTLVHAQNQNQECGRSSSAGTPTTLPSRQIYKGNPPRAGSSMTFSTPPFLAISARSRRRTSTTFLVA